MHVTNFTKGIHKIKCKDEHNDKKREPCRIKYKDCECFLEYTNFRDILIKYKFLCCNKNYPKRFDENLKKKFVNTYRFSKHDINKFIFYLRKRCLPL